MGILNTEFELRKHVKREWAMRAFPARFQAETACNSQSATGRYVLRSPHIQNATAYAFCLANLARVPRAAFVSAIFFGALGLAVVAGPSSGPCSGAFAASIEQGRIAAGKSISRLAFVQATNALAPGELAELSTAARPDGMIHFPTISTSAPASFSPISLPIVKNSRRIARPLRSSRTSRRRRCASRPPLLSTGMRQFLTTWSTRPSCRKSSPSTPSGRILPSRVGFAPKCLPPQ